MVAIAKSIASNSALYHCHGYCHETAPDIQALALGFEEFFTPVMRTRFFVLFPYDLQSLPRQAKCLTNVPQSWLTGLVASR